MQKKPKNRKTANKQIKSSHIPELSFKFSDLWTADYRLIAVILIAFPLLVYAQVYDFPLVLDDNETPIGHLKNPFVLNPSWQSFGQLFSE
ncbi:hypothetical protein SPONN_2376 [uncultured Candidatus Thioglobus sp.]|nr:hypothetical protein SPONN_2376 [uncultured Candidatus Thioglobus sp.]